MDHQKHTQAFDSCKHENLDHVLTAVSANIQVPPWSIDFERRAIEKSGRDAANHTQASTDQRPSLQLQSTYEPNDPRAFIRRKLAVRRLRRRIRLAQPYLQHPSYRKYCRRARKDVDKLTNEVVWTEETETAFQNALINIPPMGRRKKPQHGRPCGRNMLISEWILAETGRRRDRKQISSHLQTLDKIFEYEGIPEWRILNKFGCDPSGDDHSVIEYYENSVEDMVSDFHALLHGKLPGGVSTRSFNINPHVLPSSNEVQDRVSLMRLTFDMWLAAKEDMDHVIHSFSRIQRTMSTSHTQQLGSVREWRSRFPDLVPIVEALGCNDDLDLIMIDTKLLLMKEFPPVASKLGINLEAEFSQPYGKQEPGLASSFDSWICTTHIYRDGKLVDGPQISNPLSSGPMTAKPSFQASWWADEIARLTNLFCSARESGNWSEIEVAEDLARRSIDGLTFMQQISQLCQYSDVDCAGTAARPAGKIVLLWTFSLAPSDFKGIAEWYRLTLPPREAIEADIQPLNSDLVTTVRFTNDEVEGKANQDPLLPIQIDTHLPQFAADPYVSGLQDEFCQFGSMILTKAGVYHKNEAASGLDNVGNGDLWPVYKPLDPFDFCMASEQINCLSQAPVGDELETLSGSFSQVRHQDSNDAIAMLPDDPTHQLSVVEPSEQLRSQPLMHFDINTTKMLQAQLGSNGHYPGGQHQQADQSHRLQHDVGYIARKPEIDDDGDDDSVLRIALMAASNSLNDGSYLGGQLYEPAAAHATRLNTSSTRLAAPVAIRPPFMQHHSFAGVYSSNASTLEEMPRRGLSQRLEDMGAHHERFADEGGLTEFPLGDFTRSSSQPTLHTFSPIELCLPRVESSLGSNHLGGKSRPNFDRFHGA